MEGFKKVAEWKLDYSDTDIKLDIEWLEENCKDEKGVYIFTTKIPIFRLGGVTNIIYIGAASVTLKSRLNNYKSHSGRTNKRIREILMRFLSNNHRVQVYFKRTQEPEKEEEQLLRKFEEKYLELPPGNRAGG
jgi:excinuclease UvrABC nuclease subunit